MRVLLTGGAGYIGAHTAVELIAAGHEAVIFDDFSCSSPVAVERINEITGTTVPFRTIDVTDADAVRAGIVETGPFDAIIHLAARKAIGESVAKPLEYYANNVGSTIVMLGAMAEHGIDTFLFSGTGTVYTHPEDLPFVESSRTGVDLPNPYSKSKKMCEEVMVDFSRTAPEKKLIGLRYFNPIGAHESGLIGEDPQGIPNNLMPIVARVAAGILPQVSVFGRDYDTDDGTALRDYIHVVDLAKGHLAAIEHAEPGIAVFNLGTGRPTSVLELIDAFEVASGRPIPTVDAPRRPGDAQATYCLPDKAQEQLGWRAEFDTARACADYWRWQERNPAGYRTHSA
ncbi:MAG TPA: UDP-glucose 4-epimerase GalE [Gordonia sp. (in: high G+C Gram-positive bacteria)]|uniref:UDP-glucose 4-epimerase GalE n=1 Tax=unclassified Gordonia (in: high G+C Gram-positive bacteria) TaxID=2657482 RepID=UPI0025B932CC|nr:MULTISPECIES: UDP-glucose 4-epimerase GalE [unclassified Gordonia (in: high G+C Gram-positive bacteria)]HNP58337.1 UDP-glucose 4-epimerase GalE [Gordonia sp. (in: high G+C Gram-positive bacteria)]HRC52406.1 UDP-glucose 4-epimerase GalE [Gordonia sp. (in: high G+C Gram-positive bacteria)]